MTGTDLPNRRLLRRAGEALRVTLGPAERLRLEVLLAAAASDGPRPPGWPSGAEILRLLGRELELSDQERAACP